MKSLEVQQFLIEFRRNNNGPAIWRNNNGPQFPSNNCSVSL